MTITSKLNLDELASSIVRCFPTLNLVEQCLSLELYRLLAEGQPVPRTTLAELSSAKSPYAHEKVQLSQTTLTLGQSHRPVGLPLPYNKQ
jgi:hypothetical protein